MWRFIISLGKYITPFAIRVVSILLLIGITWFQLSNKDSLIKRQLRDIESLETQNQNLLNSYNQMLINVEEMRRLRLLDLKVISELGTLLEQNMVEDNENQGKQDKLEQQEPTARAYLDSPVDPGVKQLLDAEDRAAILPRL